MPPGSKIGASIGLKEESKLVKASRDRYAFVLTSSDLLFLLVVKLELRQYMD